jgi:hypothetical protein
MARVAPHRHMQRAALPQQSTQMRYLENSLYRSSVCIKVNMINKDREKNQATTFDVAFCDVKLVSVNPKRFARERGVVLLFRSVGARFIAPMTHINICIRIYLENSR